MSTHVSVIALTGLLTWSGVPFRPAHGRVPLDPEVLDDLVEHIETEALLREMREGRQPSEPSHADEVHLRALLDR